MKPAPDLPEWCGQCDKRTRQIAMTAGPQRCPACHPLASQHLSQHHRCTRCGATIRTWDKSPCGQHTAVTAA